jgi:antitoxin component of MazEF toxin-antitoxin module
MIKYLTSHGNSSAIVIEKPVLELLNITKQTALEVSTDGKNLIISPVSDAKQNKKIKSTFSKINARHSKTLKKLAE